MSAPTRVRTPATDALRDIQAPVTARLARVGEELRRIVVSDTPLIETVSGHLLQMRGKMFRPTLLLLSSAVEERPEDPRATILAAVVELVHLATLVHDDSIDHSAVRRGMPTVNSLFSHQISVIMGDFLYSRAVVELVRREESEALRVLAEASNEMSIGEMRQLTTMDPLTYTEDDYDALIRAKTAALFAAACELGALCGAPASRTALARYGARLGMAFQVQDDLLDYTEAPEVTGKPTGLDLRERKVTLPLIHALRVAGDSVRRPVQALFDAESPSDDAIAEVISLVTEAGGLEYARGRGEQFGREADEALVDVPESPARAALADAIAYVLERRS